MALRILEFTLRDAAVEDLAELLQEHGARHLWSWPAEGRATWVRVLLDASRVEGLSEALLERFAGYGDFRMVLLPVEATMPRLEDSSEGESADRTESRDAKGNLLRISREELYEDLAQASRLTPVYMVTVALSTIVAAVGLVRGDVAIVIGAMVIAPLLGPNVALALACTLGDLDLARKSLTVNLVGVLIAAVLSLAIGAAFPFDPGTAELASRTRATLGDVALALAAGAAGTLAFTSGVPAALVGVMVAVALLPPLVVAGLYAGAGFGGAALGTLLLVATNLACINLAAVTTFLLQEVRPATWWDEARARRATRIAVATWLVMIAVVVGVILLVPEGFWGLGL